MRRDPDLIRQILLALERHPGGFAPDEIAIPGFTSEQIGYHIHLLAQAGLVKAVEAGHLQSQSPQAKARELTWAGHEFLDAARNLDHWNRAKQIIASAGSASLDIWKAVLTDLVKKSLGLE
jgi:hypothetical protein